MNVIIPEPILNQIFLHALVFTFPASIFTESTVIHLNVLVWFVYNSWVTPQFSLPVQAGQGL